MNDTTIELDQTEEEIFFYQASDESLERAAETRKDKGGNFTLSFCSGLDSCPA